MIDKLIKLSLIHNSGHVSIPDGMLAKIQNKLTGNREKNFQSTSAFIGRKLVPVSLCLVAALTILTFLSPDVKAWAQESIAKIYLLVRGENGYQIEAQEVLQIINGTDFVTREIINGDVIDTKVYKNAKAIMHETDLDGSYLAEKLGFVAKMAESLPNGFKLGKKLLSQSEDVSLLLCQYDGPFSNGQFSIYMAATNAPFNANATEDAIEINIGGMNGWWLERPVPLTKDGKALFNPTLKPDTVGNANILTWLDSEICYSLIDTGNNMTQAEMMKMVSFIRTICRP